MSKFWYWFVLVSVSTCVVFTVITLWGQVLNNGAFRWTESNKLILYSEVSMFTIVALAWFILLIRTVRR